MHSAGHPTTAPAGRPSGRAATVAAVGEEEFPEMDSASVAALAALDWELQQQDEIRGESYHPEGSLEG